jgi:hypothetical protein
MSVIRVHKNANYTVMSNNHFKERQMSLKAKGLLSLMLSLPDDWNYSISGLVKLSKDGKDSVMSALGELEDFGYLVRHRTTNSKGQFSGIEYNIYEEPQRDIPIAGKQNEEKQKADKANAETPPQLNTKELNNKELNINKENTKDIYIELESILNKEITNKELIQLFKEYIEMRNSINAPISARGLKMLIQRCARLANLDIELQKALVETAIINNWKNVYLPNEQDIQNNNTLASLKRYYGGI